MPDQYGYYDKEGFYYDKRGYSNYERQHVSYLGQQLPVPGKTPGKEPMASDAIGEISARVTSIMLSIEAKTGIVLPCAPICTVNDHEHYKRITSKDPYDITQREEEFLLKLEWKLLDYGDARWKRDYTRAASPALKFTWGDPRPTRETQEINNVSTKKESKQTMASTSNTKLVALPNTAQVTSAFKTAVEDAAWTTCAEQAVELSKVALKASLTHSDDPRAAMAAAFLNTPEGTAFLGAILSSVPFFSPALAADPRAARLTDKMRVNSAKFVTDFFAKHLVGPISAAFTQALAAAPKVEEK